MDYRVCLVAADDMHAECEQVALLSRVGDSDAWTFLDLDLRFQRELNEFLEEFETAGVVLRAEMLSGGREHAFDMWITGPSYLSDLDALVFPDVVHAVFDYKVDGLYVRLSPAWEGNPLLGLM